VNFVHKFNKRPNLQFTISTVKSFIQGRRQRFKPGQFAHPAIGLYNLQFPNYPPCGRLTLGSCGHRPGPATSIRPNQWSLVKGGHVAPYLLGFVQIGRGLGDWSAAELAVLFNHWLLGKCVCRLLWLCLGSHWGFLFPRLQLCPPIPGYVLLAATPETRTEQCQPNDLYRL